MTALVWRSGMCTLNCVCNVGAQFLAFAVYWTYVHCTLGSLLKQCRGCALLTVGCFGELQSMGCSAESEVHFVEHTASCGEQRVCGDQCILLRALQVVESRGSGENCFVNATLIAATTTYRSSLHSIITTCGIVTITFRRKKSP